MAPKLKFLRSKPKFEHKPSPKADLHMDAASVYSQKSARSHHSNGSSEAPVPVDKRIVAKQRTANTTFNYCYNTKHNHGYGGPTLLDVAMGESSFPEMDMKKNHSHTSGGGSSKGGAPHSVLSKESSLRCNAKPAEGHHPPVEISFDYPGVGPPNYTVPDTISTKVGSVNSKSEHSAGKIPNVIQSTLESVYYDLMETKQGDVASYIPELANANADDFGIAICTASGGRVYEIGNTDVEFSIQSVAKPFAYALALSIYGEDHMRQRVGIQPGGVPGALNVDLDTGRPINPMVRSGALTAIAEVVDACDGNMERSEREIIKFFSDLASRNKKERLKPDENVYSSEKNYSDETQNVVNALSSHGTINADDDAVLDLFFRQRSVNVTCRDLAIMGATLAANGVNPRSGIEVCPSEASQLTLSLMGSCGMNKYPGQWMNDVGMPAMCGASGGVVAVAPGRLALAVYSPRLDKFGNPLRAVAACIEISRQLGVNLFLQEPKLQKMIASKQMFRSRKWRPETDVDCLEANKDLLRVITSPSVVDYVFVEEATSILSRSQASFVILDMSNVTEINPTSEVLLEELIRSIINASTQLLVCTSPGSKCYLCSPDDHPRVFWPIDEKGSPMYTNIHTHSLDAALEAAEDFILKVKSGKTDDKIPSFFELLSGTQTSEEMLKKHFTEQTFTKGEVILKPQEVLANLFVIQSGHYTAWKENVRVATYGPGTTFGEICFAGHETRCLTTVVSESEGSCLIMSAESFKKLRLRFPQAAIDLLLLLNTDLSHNLRHMSDQLVMMK
jgi:glutaminase